MAFLLLHNYTDFIIKIVLYIIIKLLKEKRSEKYYEINEFCSY